MELFRIKYESLFCIGSNNDIYDGIPDASKKKAPNGSTSMLTNQDKINFTSKEIEYICHVFRYLKISTTNCAGDYGDTKEIILVKLKRFFNDSHNRRSNSIIYYTGHGQEGTGDWVFTPSDDRRNYDTVSLAK